MRLEDFLLLLLNNWLLYIVSVLISCLLLRIVYKKYVISVLDPLCYQLLGALFANSVPLFLFFCDEIRLDIFLSFIIIETLFWIGFMTNKPKCQCESFNIVSYYRSTYKLFLIASFFVVASQLYYYATKGLPIFFDSRIDKYDETNAGLGILERLTYVMSPFCIIYSFAHFKSKCSKKRILSRLYLCFALFTFVASGSKGAFLGFLSPLFFYFTFIAKVKIERKHLILVGALAVCVAVMVIMLLSSKEEGSQELSPLLKLAYRVMMYGDCYYESYGYNVIDHIKIDNPIRDLLVNLLAPFRLMSYGVGTDTAPSIQVHNMVYPEITTLGGPNNRAPLLFYCLFGWIGPIVSFFFGKLTSYLMYKVKFNKGLIGVSIYCALYQATCSFITDPVLALGFLPSFIIGYIFFKITMSIVK